MAAEKATLRACVRGRWDKRPSAKSAARSGHGRCRSVLTLLRLFHMYDECNVLAVSRNLSLMLVVARQVARLRSEVGGVHLAVAGPVAGGRRSCCRRAREGPAATHPENHVVDVLVAFHGAAVALLVLV